MASVTLDAAEFKALYPEFDYLEDAQINNLFLAAQLYLDNSNCSIVTDEAKRKYLMYLLTAHLAYMRYGDKDGNGGNSGLVGRLSSATEGSVSVSADLGSGAEFRYAWYTQSPYGLDYWQATKIYRMGNYYPGGNCGCGR